MGKNRGCPTIGPRAVFGNGTAAACFNTAAPNLLQPKEVI